MRISNSRCVIVAGSLFSKSKQVVSERKDSLSVQTRGNNVLLRGKRTLVG